MVPDSDDSRHRRRFLTGTAVATAATAAGCANAIQPGNRSANQQPIREGEPSMDESAFEEYVGEQRDTYGNSGVWGVVGDPPPLDHVGAWTARTYVTKSGDPYDGDASDVLVVADHAVALYEIPGRVSENGKQSHAVWLWTGARVPDRNGGLLTGQPVVRALRTGVELNAHTEDMLSYSPSVDVRNPQASVSIPPPDVDFSTTVPLRGGDVGPVAAATHVGAEGGYAVEWSGEAAPVQSVNGVCVVQWHPDVDFDFNWSVVVAGGRKFRS